MKGCGIFLRIEKIHEFISVAFIGTQAQWEAFVPRNKSSFRGRLQILQVRADVVYKWLKALKVLNPYYRDVEIDESLETFQALEELPLNLMRKATIVTDTKEIIVDKIIGKEVSDRDETSTSSCHAATKDAEFSLPTSFVTRANRPNADGTSASTSTFKGIFFFFVIEIG